MNTTILRRLVGVLTLCAPFFAQAQQLLPLGVLFTPDCNEPSRLFRTEVPGTVMVHSQWMSDNRPSIDLYFFDSVPGDHYWVYCYPARVTRMKLVPSVAWDSAFYEEVAGIVNAVAVANGKSGIPGPSPSASSADQWTRADIEVLKANATASSGSAAGSFDWLVAGMVAAACLGGFVTAYRLA